MSDDRLDAAVRAWLKAANEFDGEVMLFDELGERELLVCRRTMEAAISAYEGDAPNPPAHEWEGLGPK
jgi:hypothetical protein